MVGDVHFSHEKVHISHHWAGERTLCHFEAGDLAKKIR